MSKKEEIPDRIGTQGWKQFLAAKQEMLYQYELSKLYAESHIVKVTHGNVAEATFRKWLNSFLPKKYAVAPGYIVSQNRDFVDLKLPHYDVIIYDQINSPVLWVEENSDYSEAGKTKAIPSEYVKAVIEVKANLTEISSKNAIKKLRELIPLLSKDNELSPYNGKLPSQFFTGVVFFELLIENEYKKNILNNLVTSLDLPYYGGIILKGEGRSVDDTGQFRTIVGKTNINSTVGKNKESLIQGNPISDTLKSRESFVGTMLTWNPANFSEFAFDLVALIEGRYRPGFVSSNYGMSWMNPARHNR